MERFATLLRSSRLLMPRPARGRDLVTPDSSSRTRHSSREETDCHVLLRCTLAVDLGAAYPYRLSHCDLRVRITRRILYRTTHVHSHCRESRNREWEKCGRPDRTGRNSFASKSFKILARARKFSHEMCTSFLIKGWASPNRKIVAACSTATTHYQRAQTGSGERPLVHTEGDFHVDSLRLNCTCGVRPLTNEPAL